DSPPAEAITGVHPEHGPVDLLQVDGGVLQRHVARGDGILRIRVQLAGEAYWHEAQWVEAFELAAPAAPEARCVEPGDPAQCWLAGEDARPDRGGAGARGGEQAETRDDDTATHCDAPSYPASQKTRALWMPENPLEVLSATFTFFLMPVFGT